MKAYDVLPFKADRKLSLDEIYSVKSIKWSGIKEFSSTAGTIYYFPIIYTPQALGLTIGKMAGLTIDASYQLAKVLTLASIAIILFTAFSIYPILPLTIALLLLPMSVFQISSASLDGISTALSIFSIAAFLRISSDKENSRHWMFYLLTLSIFLLATHRVNLLPLLALEFGACCYIKNNRFFIVFAMSLLAVLAWTAIAIMTMVDLQGGNGCIAAKHRFVSQVHPLKLVR